MNMLQIMVVNEFPASIPLLLPHPEVEAAPGNERGLVSQSSQIEIGFGMKFRHQASYFRDWSLR
jgi:hypothetical protein